MGNEAFNQREILKRAVLASSREQMKDLLTSAAEEAVLQLALRAYCTTISYTHQERDLLVNGTRGADAFADTSVADHFAEAALEHAGDRGWLEVRRAPNTPRRYVVTPAGLKMLADKSKVWAEVIES
jgi:hypothetical protein